MGIQAIFSPPAPAVCRQRGAIAVMFAALLVLMLTFMGLALDLSRLYNRKVELQALADAAALAAARSLTGTQGGITNASVAASNAASALKTSYDTTPVNWSPGALTFAATPDSTVWIDAGAANAAPATLMFARVDTAQLDAGLGTIETILMRIVSDQQTANASARAVAGRSTINVTPLAICALSPVAASSRAPGGELVQYGFRRGVGYDLMQLNPNPGATTGEHFVINPIDPAGQLGSANNAAPDIVSPFVCAGEMPITLLQGLQLTVRRPFPLGSLYQQLNSRFDQYDGGYCTPAAAAPDKNVKAYTYDSGVNWLTTQPTMQTAMSATSASLGLRTIADFPNAAGNAANQFGVLWSYAKPVPFSAYSAGVPEPASGYTPFNKTVWPTLFAPAGTPVPKANYPATTPYLASGGANYSTHDASHGLGLRQRRVLNVPLLACPVAAGANVQATVLAIGRFFMTVPATPSSISGEFVGIAAEGSLGGAVELYQ